MKYLAITRHIIDTSLHNDFVEDILHCQNNRIPISVRGATYHAEGDIQVFRADGKNFNSGHDYWTHNNTEYPILGKRFDDKHFTEDLFTI